jgi:hypothetical protein
VNLILNNSCLRLASRIGRIKLKAFCVLLAALAFFACTRAAPSIDFWTMRTVWQKIDGIVVPTMIFFVTANDPDGTEDLSELRLYHDGEGLLWRFTSENWIKLEEGGRTWIGSKQLRMPQGENFPSGQFRAVVLDKAGEQAEKGFGFDSPQDSRYRFPVLKIENEAWSIVSDYPENYLLCYHSDGVYRSLVKLEGNSGTLVSLRLSTDVFSVALWADDSNAQISAITAPVNVR